MNCFFTVVSADHFQFYIPLYVAALRTWSKDDIIIVVRGKVNDDVEKMVEGQAIIKEGYADYPFNISTTNCIRFVCGKDLRDYENVMITDIDLMLFDNPWYWHVSQLHEGCFSGHHGPFYKPHRPEVCESWTGDWERIAGGLFMVTRGWWRRTDIVRHAWSICLEKGTWGTFREADEVMLARIIKSSSMTVPQSRYMPSELRGIHLGDFKFDHRWTNEKKMKNLLADSVCMKYPLIKPIGDKVAEMNNELKDTLQKVEKYLRLRHV